jgi:glucan 1,3-beta-glucosidase
MIGIAANGVAPYFVRELSFERKEFLRNYVEAQIVTFENGVIGTLSAWFYWTLKVEGGAFAERSFLRGIDEGWIPPIPASNTSSESLFGSCEDILFRSSDNRIAIVEEFPDPMYLPPVTDPLKIIDDNVVISHGESLLHPDRYKNNEHDFLNRHYHYHWYHWLPLGLVFFALGIAAFREWMRRKAKYVRLGFGS